MSPGVIRPPVRTVRADPKPAGAAVDSLLHGLDATVVHVDRPASEEPPVAIDRQHRSEQDEVVHSPSTTGGTTTTGVVTMSREPRTETCTR